MQVGIIMYSALENVAKSVENLLEIGSWILLAILGTNISIIQGISGVALRSYASKVVSETDVGKAQSLFAIVETLAQTAFVPIYNEGIYSRTIEIFPQAFFLAGIVLLSIAILLIM